MRIAIDQYVNGVKPEEESDGPEPAQRLCVELRSADGRAWVQVAPGDEDLPTEADLIAAESAELERVDLVANPSGFWPTIALESGAQVSARPGYPRLILS